MDGDSVPINAKESQRHFKLAVAEGNSEAQVEYAIAGLLGRFGSFYIEKARDLLTQAASSSPELAKSRLELPKPGEKALPELGHTSDTIFNLIRDRDGELVPDQFSSWRHRATLVIPYLFRLAGLGRAKAEKWKKKLFQCESVDEMIPVIFNVHSAESPLYRNVNAFLRSLPVSFVAQFILSLHGLIAYCSLLQSAIEHAWKREQEAMVPSLVFRGLGSDGRKIADKYAGLIGKDIVWLGFTSTSPDCELVMTEFVCGRDGILFQIELPGNAKAANIAGFSEYQAEDEVLIAAVSVFRVLEVNPSDYVVPVVRLGWLSSQ